jgi:hypothetical protein
MKWSEKLRAARPHAIAKAPMTVGEVKKGAAMLTPSPLLLDAEIRLIPQGQSRDLGALRRALAARHGAEITCPIATAAQIRIVAEAAYESLGAGRPIGEITPFWRVLDQTAPTAAKLACGPDFIARRRAAEGIAPPQSQPADETTGGYTQIERSLWA